MQPRKSQQLGFTLLELIVALAVLGLIALGVRAVAERMSDSFTQLALETQRSDREANGDHLLRALLLRLEVGPRAATPFFGDEHTLRFSSWCEVALGWQERCAVTMVIGTSGDAPSVIVELPHGEHLALRRGFVHAEWRYLTSAAGGGSWVSRWGEGLSVPAAVGLLMHQDANAARADTLILRTGDRS